MAYGTQKDDEMQHVHKEMQNYHNETHNYQNEPKYDAKWPEIQNNQKTGQQTKHKICKNEHKVLQINYEAQIQT